MRRVVFCWFYQPAELFGNIQAYTATKFREGGSALWLLPWVPTHLLFLSFWGLAALIAPKEG